MILQDNETFDVFEPTYIKEALSAVPGARLGRLIFGEAEWAGIAANDLTVHHLLSLAPSDDPLTTTYRDLGT